MEETSEMVKTLEGSLSVLRAQEIQLEAHAKALGVTADAAPDEDADADVVCMVNFAERLRRSGDRRTEFWLIRRAASAARKRLERALKALKALEYAKKSKKGDI